MNKEGAEQKHSELRGRRRWLLTTREHGGAINMTTPKIPSDQARVPNVGEESSAEKRTWSRWIADVSPMTVRFHRFRPGSEASHITITNVRFGSIALKKSASDRSRRCREGGDERRLFCSQAGIGFGPPISLAILRRFWAAAARWNSSRAPQGPRNLRRSSFRMRLR